MSDERDLSVSHAVEKGSSSSIASAPPPAQSAKTHPDQPRPDSVGKHLPETEDADSGDEIQAPSFAVLGRKRRYGLPALNYLLKTEVHTYAFSVAANAILSFFPFIVLLLTVTRRVFHSADMYNIIIELVRQYLPSNQDFVIRNLQFLASVKGRGQILSGVMLLITSTGVFLPLEVALNSVWGFKKNRSYLMNGVVALGLALLCGTLALLSVAATAKALNYLAWRMGDGTLFYRSGEFLALKLAAIVCSVAIYFVIYWLLPNGRVPVRAVIPAAIIMALLTEAAKYLYIWSLHWLNFPEVYGPFAVSVTLMFWAYISGMLLLVGAYLSASRHIDRVQARQGS
jgi:YihY family inner membrane protein